MNKKLLAVAISGALTVPMAAQAVKYKLSGQVNRAVMYVDDDTASDIHHVDNISSGTRVRLKGSEEIGNGMKVGFNWEWQTSSNPSSGGQALKAGDATGFTQSLRKAEVWFSGNWGKLSIGQGQGAGDGTTEVDLSNTWNVAYVGRTSFGAAQTWRTGAGGTIAGALTHGGTANHNDAFGRYDRVRYDSPALGPVTFAASIGQNERWEVAGRVSTGLAGGQLSGGVHYGSASGVDHTVGGSLSYLFSQGTNITFSLSEVEDVAGADRQNWYVKLGHRWGNNAVSVAYGESDDVTPGFTDAGFQVGFNHNIPKAKVDIYAGYHSNELDTPTGVASVGDITAFVVGTKLKFD